MRCTQRIARMAQAAALLLIVALSPLPVLAQDRESPSGSVVEVTGSRTDGYVFVVDGRPQPIRGMGYNAILGGLSGDARAERLNRDFDLMRRVGINTIIAWDQPAMDAMLLDAAHANGIGVVMHFELGKRWNYADADLRERLLAEIDTWVLTYRDHPAVRMWGVGNEVLLTTSDDESRAFAEFFVQAYQRVRALDTHHPITYREAEDVRVPFFRDAFALAGVAPDGFIFGMNWYTPRIDDALTNWDDHQFPVPTFISEFAPAGIAPSTRARSFGEMWALVQKHEGLVLGAAPYTWTTEGPEAVDRIFGLTDEQGRPVDEALAAVQRLYLGDAARVDELPPVAGRTTSDSDLDLETAFTQALARAFALPELSPIDIATERASARALYLADLSGAPGAVTAEPARVERMLNLLAATAALARLERGGVPVYSGAVEALPLLAGMARWSLVDPQAELVAHAFALEVLSQALRTEIA